MTAKYFALLTNLGAAKLANMAALGTKLQITQMAVGDGNGALPSPDPTQTALVAEKRRAALNSLSIDTANSSQIIAEQVIPENEGGFWIREIGLYDSDGDMIAVANCPETYKPLLQEGSGRTQIVRMILIINSTDAVTLKIDPSVVLATRQYVDEAVIEVKAYADNLMRAHVAATDPHSQYASKASPTLTGVPKAPTAVATKNDTQLATTAFVQAVIRALLSSDTDSSSETQAATSKAVKNVKDNALRVHGVISNAVNLNDFGPTDDYAGIWWFSYVAPTVASVNLPEPVLGILEVFKGGSWGCTQRYTTRFGAVYLRCLAATWDPASPSWENWKLLGDQPIQGYVSTDLNKIVTPGTYSVSSQANINAPLPAGLTGILEVKLRLSANSVKQTFTTIVAATNIYANRSWQRTLSGATWSAWNEMAKFSDLLPTGIPLPWPTAAAPSGWLKCNGASFSATAYPELAKVYPALKLPDLRGEFIRGLDDGRGVDSGRKVLTAQGHQLASHAHSISAWDAYDGSVLTPNDREGDRLLSTDNAIATGGGVNGRLNGRYSTELAGGNENRPRNVAFNYIVRAA